MLTSWNPSNALSLASTSGHHLKAFAWFANHLDVSSITCSYLAELLFLSVSAMLPPWHPLWKLSRKTFFCYSHWYSHRIAGLVKFRFRFTSLWTFEVESIECSVFYASLHWRACFQESHSFGYSTCHAFSPLWCEEVREKVEKKPFGHEFAGRKGRGI